MRHLLPRTNHRRPYGKIIKWSIVGAMTITASILTYPWGYHCHYVSRHCRWGDMAHLLHNRVDNQGYECHNIYQSQFNIRA